MHATASGIPTRPRSKCWANATLRLAITIRVFSSVRRKRRWVPRAQMAIPIRSVAVKPLDAFDAYGYDLIIA
jgi:hypothetical protein